MKIFCKVIKGADFIDRFVVRYIGERLFLAIGCIFLIGISYVWYKLTSNLKQDEV